MRSKDRAVFIATNLNPNVVKWYRVCEFKEAAHLITAEQWDHQAVNKSILCMGQIHEAPDASDYIKELAGEILHYLGQMRIA